MENLQLCSLILGNVLKEGATHYLVTLSDTYAQKSMATSLGTGQNTMCNELFDYARKWMKNNCKSQTSAVKERTHFLKDAITIVSSVIFEHILL